MLATRGQLRARGCRTGQAALERVLGAIAVRQSVLEVRPDLVQALLVRAGLLHAAGDLGDRHFEDRDQAIELGQEARAVLGAAETRFVTVTAIGGAVHPASVKHRACQSAGRHGADPRQHWHRAYANRRAASSGRRRVGPSCRRDIRRPRDRTRRVGPGPTAHARRCRNPAAGRAPPQAAPDRHAAGSLSGILVRRHAESLARPWKPSYRVAPFVHAAGSAPVMTPRSFRILAATLAAAAPLAAQDLSLGKMWTFERPPLAYLEKEYGFHPTQE